LVGAVLIVFIYVLPFVIGTTSSLAIFSSWVVGWLSACLLGAIQLGRSFSSYRYRPQIERHLAMQLLGVGLPNYVLTLAERAPAPIIAIVVTELLSPIDNAHWYAVWQMAWLVFIVPIQVAMTLFAEAAHRPESLGNILGHGVRWSLALGITAAAGLAVLAPVVLSFLGHSYAVAGATPLRILVVAVLPITFIQMYFAVCRATQQLREAILIGTLNAVLSVSGAVLAGMSYGLTGIAVAWLVVQVAIGIWAVVRVRFLSKQYRAASARDIEQALVRTDVVAGIVPGDPTAL
jgi:O-antigen/teichoic acid export membrane protein